MMTMTEIKEMLTDPVFYIIAVGLVGCLLLSS